MNKRLVAMVFLMAVTLALAFEQVVACTYGPPYRTVCETYAIADSVVIAQVKDVKTRGTNQIVVLKVNKSFKGPARKELVLSQPLSTCDWDFSGKEGQELLLYIDRNGRTGRYKAIAEGMGGTVDREQENLYWLNKLPGARRRTRISGTVELYQTEPFGFLSYTAGTKVRIFNERTSYEVFTDKNGVYEKWDVPTGKYKIEAALTPGLQLRFGLERGLIDFGPAKEDEKGYGISLVKIRRNGCGGIDFVVNKKSKK